MKMLTSVIAAAALALATVPSLAQGTNNGSSASVPGLGPGGSGDTSSGSGAAGTAGKPGAAPATGASGETQNQVLQKQGVPAGNKPAE